jgi:flagellar motor component MotA
VWQRSTESLYQAGLLAAVIAIIPHFLWVVLRGDRHRMGDAYDRFAAWGQTVLTSLGFLGTVVGISLAVGGLEAAMREDEPGRLIAGLSTAFDTTFLGLVGAIMLLVLRKLVSLGAVQ